jgi:peptide/nickel transport system permease protein
MARYIAYRLALVVPLLLGAALLVFVAGHLAPGDPVQVLLGDHYNPQTAVKLRHDLGLDRPMATQFVLYVWKAGHFDFGTSYVNPARRVNDIIRQTLPVSVVLAALAVALAAAVGVAVGVVGATHPRSASDYGIQAAVILGLSVPSFVVAAVLVLLFALHWRLFPAAGWGGWQTRVLPVAVLAAAPLAYIARITRTSVIQAVSQDYVRTARSKGLTSSTVLIRHVLRNAALPIVTIVGMAFGYAITGAFVVEVVFNIPGMARVGVDAILQRDYSVIETVVLVYTALFIVINLAVDLSYVFLNPRVRY